MVAHSECYSLGILPVDCNSSLQDLPGEIANQRPRLGSILLLRYSVRRKSKFLVLHEYKKTDGVLHRVDGAHTTTSNNHAGLGDISSRYDRTRSKMHALLLFTTFLVPLTLGLPTDPFNTTEVGIACGAALGDCPTLTCIPLSKECTDFGECPGTCQYINIAEQRIYTLCGGWGYYDDCDERIEFCGSDPRNSGCGPSCDDMGICHVTKDYCGGPDMVECSGGKVCFEHIWGHNPTTLPDPEICRRTPEGGWACGGTCFPLRFGSDSYAKTRLEEVIRKDQDGRQGDDGN